MNQPSRQSCRLPRYPSKPHSTGQARIQVDGKVIYLGRFGSQESKRKFAQVLAEITSAPRIEQVRKECTVAELCAAFLSHAESRYVKRGKQTSEVSVFKIAIRAIVAIYADLPANQFGAPQLAVLQHRLLESYCRSSVNRYSGKIRAIWQWGVQQGAIRPEVWMSLKAVSPVRRGRGKETSPVTCVPQEHVDAALACMRGQVRDMVIVQQLTGMRPGEVRSMDWGMIDTSGPIWEYRPESHKTEHHGRDRVIYLGPKAQAILAGRKRGGLVFPCRRGVMRGATYTSAIRRACKRAGVPPWSPNRLRHNAATEVRRTFDLDVARAVLGHSTASMTEVYAERDQSLARKVAEVLG